MVCSFQQSLLGLILYWFSVTTVFVFFHVSFSFVILPAKKPALIHVSRCT